MEVADLLHAQGDPFIEPASVAERPAADACSARITRCRTAGLGGHLDQCSPAVIRPSPITRVGTGTVRSVRPRRANAGSLARERELLDVPYFHVVFTLPHAAERPVPAQRPHAVRPAFPRQRRHPARGRRRPATSGRADRLPEHPAHVGANPAPCIRTCTASCRPAASPRIISAGFIRSTPASSCPVKVLSRVFRGKFVEGLRRAFDRERAGPRRRQRAPPRPRHAGTSSSIHSSSTDWVVYAKPAFGGAIQPCSAISGATRIASRSAITGCSPSMAST